MLLVGGVMVVVVVSEDEVELLLGEGVGIVVINVFELVVIFGV